MEAHHALLEEANWIARSLRGNEAKLPDEARYRFNTYKVRNRFGEFVCPKCWLRQGIESTLRPIPGTDEYDLLRCNNDFCGAEIVVPL